VIVEATVRLVGISEEFASAIAAFPSVNAASRAVSEIIRCGIDPAALELLATECMDLMQKIKDLFDPKGILNPGKMFPIHK